MLPIAYFVYLYTKPSRGKNHLEKFNRGSIMSCKLHMRNEAKIFEMCEEVQ